MRGLYALLRGFGPVNPRNVHAREHRARYERDARRITTHAFGPRTNANFNQGCQIT